MIHRRLKIQLAVFGVVALLAVGLMAVGYMRVPAALGIGRYTVTVEFPRSAGLYASGDVTYRGVEVGTVRQVRLTRTGVEAVLSLKSGIDVPSDVEAAVHSRSAIGEQYVALMPRSEHSPPLKDGAVIPITDTSVPPEINSVLDAADRGLDAIPRDNLKTVVDESYTAFGGLGPEISRLVRNSTTLAIDARKNLDSITALVDQSKPVLDSQTDTADSVHAWAANLATISAQLKAEDNAVAGILSHGPGSADEVRALLDRVQPTLPVLLANLVSVGEVGIAYRANIEQLLVLIPQSLAILQSLNVPNQHTQSPYKGAFLNFALNLNLPPPCATGFLPARQQRAPVFEDYPDRPAGDLFCRIPQDSNFAVRGARNTPCATVPGKRAPTVRICESDEQYVPLNDGLNWKGDPNATLSGQDVPVPPEASIPASAPEPAPPPIAVAPYDPATGSYMGPDGRVYTQADLAQNATQEKTWQEMLLPPNPK